MFCSACAAPASKAAKFCSSCGAALAAAPVLPAEERRLVTVVFCDLVGSTALSGHLDPEVLRSVTLRYFDLMRASLQAHGGTVEKFIGDAVMAVFGVPQLHEDDARRALAATVDMTAALAQYNLELQVNLGVQLGVRIGVNTGEVIAATDPSADQALVSGEVVNVAARLEQNAAIGQILMGAATVQAAGRAAVVRAIGPLQLKGKGQPVPAYQLLELLADDPEVLRRFDVSFIGRDLELAELDLMLDRTRRTASLPSAQPVRGSRHRQDPAGPHLAAVAGPATGPAGRRTLPALRCRRHAHRAGRGDRPAAGRRRPRDSARRCP